VTLFLSSASFFCGCGGNSNVGSVTGTVTLDGNPVSGALVSFTPKKGGSPSVGRTDDSGKYFLQYTRDQQGAEIGEHSVKITTYLAADPEADPPQAEVPEKIPIKYNYKTELTKEVKSGTNTIDLELQGGEVIQPKVIERYEAIRERNTC
jgi:hypothetical protein